MPLANANLAVPDPTDQIMSSLKEIYMWLSCARLLSSMKNESVLSDPGQSASWADGMLQSSNCKLGTTRTVIPAGGVY